MGDYKKYYVLLAGSKNDAGDFLIKTRAKSLLAHYRKDRDFVDLDGWKKLSNEHIETINNAEALILTGGPSLQPGSRIENLIYPFIKELDKIKVPIYTFGVGYKGNKGTWGENSDYAFSDLSMELLKRIDHSGGKSSVRDYHTLDVLQKKGFQNFVMTGCPALYNVHDELKPISKLSIKRVGFSLGVSYKLNDSMKSLMEEMILSAASHFKDAEMIVYFHHKINAADKVQSKMISFLEKNEISYMDISGTSEKLMSQYESCDLHLGFRVHAHIFCSSMGIPSILFSEDGRAIALKEVLNGLIYRAHEISGDNIPAKVLNRIGLKDRFVAVDGLVETIKNTIDYENRNGCIRFNQAFANITSHRKVMEDFIRDLP